MSSNGPSEPFARTWELGAVVDLASATLLSDRSPMPLYHRLYVILRDRIAGGTYPQGAVLPSEFELTAAFNVSRITAKRALDELATEGLVERVRGRGTTVTDRAASLRDARPITASIDGLRENLTAIGRETSVEVLEFGYVTAPDFVRAQLELKPDMRAQRAVRVRSLDGEPLSQSTTYIPEQIGSAYTAKDLASTPIIELIERAGVVVGAAEQSISATLADSLVAARLKVRAGAPLLLMKRCVKDISGKPVQYIEILYRPDRFEYRMSLTRDQTAGHGRFAAAGVTAKTGNKVRSPRKRRTHGSRGGVER